jgi:hypothetical protein
MSHGRWDILKLKGFPRFLVLAAAAVFAWLAWPVSLWILGAFLVHWALRALADHLEAERQRGERGLLRAAGEIASRSLCHAVGYIGFGVFLVGLAQAVLWAGSNMFEPRHVRQVEETLSWSYQSLTHVLDLHVMAAIMGGVLLIAVLLPRLQVMERFLKLKDVATKGTLVLLGTTSFTFFGALDLDRLDPEWRAVERAQARATLAEIDEQTREMTAAAWVESETRRLDPTRQQEFARFFDAARAQPLPKEIVRKVAVELARKAPKVDANVVNATKPQPAEGVISERVRKYVQADAPEIHLLPPELPPLSEVRVANERLTRFESRVRAARTASIELAAEAIAEFVPKADKELISTFVKELTSTLSKSALHEVVPRSVTDVASAQAWVKRHLSGAQAAARGAIAEAWAFHPSSLETKVGSGPRAAEAAIASLVSRLNAQAVHEQTINRVRIPTSLDYVPSHSTGPRIRVRR